MSKPLLFKGTLYLGIVSFLCLCFYYLALTDIWHESGRPDFWRGAGSCSVEWRILGICFFPMLLFHVCFFAMMIVFMNRKTLPTPDKEIAK